MKKINPIIFQDTRNGYELWGDLNYPTFMKELLFKPTTRKELHNMGEITHCLPLINSTFLATIKEKYGISKVTWVGTVRVLTKDLIEYE